MPEEPIVPSAGQSAPSNGMPTIPGVTWVTPPTPVVPPQIFLAPTIPGVTIVSPPVPVDVPALNIPGVTIVSQPTPVVEASPAAPSAPVVIEPAAVVRKKILIVEDERPLARALELKLGHDGYDTMVASTGTKGLEEASNNKYDLVLLDLILPELDGFELLRQLREKGSKVPVIILSNLGQEEDRKRVENYNVAQYCVKSNMPLSAIVNTVKVLTA